MRAVGYFEAGGMRLRDDPARESSLRLVRSDTEMHEYPPEDPRALREMVHRHMTNEVTSLEIAAECVAAFPDAPWELRMELARQCWDESRHVLALARRLAELGGRRGEFPTSTFEWNVTSAVDNLEGRLAIQNRTLEAGAMDVVGSLEREVRAMGDEQTADVLAAILADEVQHVRFANRWIKTLAGRDPRVLMRVASAVRFLSDANAHFQAAGAQRNAVGTLLPPPEERVPAVNVEDRRLAEFSDDEIQEILTQAGFRSLLPTADGTGP